MIQPTEAESIRLVVGPQFSDLFWLVACGLCDFFFLKVAGRTRVQGVISVKSTGVIIYDTYLIISKYY